MERVLLMVFGPALLGLVAALAVWLIARPRSSRPAVSGAVRWSTLAGVLLASGIVLAQLLLGTTLVGFPLRSPTALMMTSFTAPLIAGLIAVVLLMVPVVRRSGDGTAELHRRTLTSFGSRWWFLTLAGAVLLVVLATVWPGLASVPDDQGRYTMYWIDMGPGSSMGSTIYGWYFSRPSLALVVLLVVAGLVVVWLISRPPLAPDREHDVAVRRWRTRNVLAMATGALLLHLARVVDSLAGTASIYGQTQTDQGLFTTRTPFAALEGPLRVAADILEAGAWLLWFTVLLIAVTRSARTRDDGAVRSSWRSASS
ncbi:hypothetical protein PU560_11115 [Georgenia sp. 10Sc9-8]|uniref:Cytochrome c oxidase assembly protein n=1 Tax=Georgenia halotolerans TaxID=3028317 RepID=A0ABT5TYI1_9MICO|nr:hypothetical protein [Georgenia halotolerans]